MSDLFPNPQIIYCSLHQFPCYPGTGQKEYRGKHDNILNLPINPGSKIDYYESLFLDRVIPFFGNFSPDIIIISAGYDANQKDPLATMALQPEDFGLLTQYLTEISSRLLFGLEGGYHLEALAQSVVATLKNLL